MSNEEIRDQGTQTVICPHCGYPLRNYDGGAFCSECGGDLRGPDGTLPSTVAVREARSAPEPPPPVPDDRDLLSETPTLDLPPQAASPSSSPSIPPACSPPPPTPTQGKKPKNKCPDLNARYNVSRVFVGDASMCFDLLLTPRVEDLSEICVVVHLHDAHHRDHYYRECVMDIPEQGEELDVGINFIPPKGMFGKLSFTFYVTYVKEGKTQWYLARRKHWLFPPYEKAQVAIDKLEIDLRTTINQGNASDIHVNQRLDSLKHLAAALVSKDDTAEKLTTDDLPEVWEALPLRRCVAPTGERVLQTTPRLYPPQPVQAVRRSRMTLHVSGRRIHLVSLDRVQFGRNRDNSVVIRRVVELRREEVSSRMSKFHFRIERRGNEVWAVDKASAGGGHPARASAHGTYLDGTRIPPGQALRIYPNRDHVLSLAGASEQDPGVVSLHVKLFTCGSGELAGSGYPETTDPSEPACLVIHRADEVPESYLVVWRYAALAPGWIWRCQDAFAWRENNHCRWLEAGAQAGAATAGAFEQWGLEQPEKEK